MRWRLKNISHRACSINGSYYYNYFYSECLEVQIESTSGTTKLFHPTASFCWSVLAARGREWWAAFEITNMCSDLLVMCQEQECQVSLTPMGLLEELEGLPSWLSSKELPANAEDVVWYLIWEGPRCCGAAKPECLNPLGLCSRSFWADAPQLLKPTLHKERPP